MSTIPGQPPLLGFDKKKSGVWFDLNRLIISRLLIQANSGGGKSRAIRYICEQTHGRVQHIVLDREGEFATLREQYDYLLVGRDGEKAASVRTAKVLARLLLELRLSAVIDLSDMPLAEQRQYVATFTDGVNHLPRALWAPHGCLIIYDEAHVYAPEKGKGSSVATEPLSLLLSTSRKRGFCPILATQRLAKLDKDVAAECLNKLIGRTSSEDTARAADELGQSKQASRELRTLDPGEFWAYGPALSREPVLVRTGEVKTHPPKLGSVRNKPPATPEAIKAALAGLAELEQEAAEEEQSMAELRRTVARLQAESAAASRAQKTVTRTETVKDPDAERRGYTRGQADARKALERLVGRVAGVAGQVDRELGQFQENIEKSVGAISQLTARIRELLVLEPIPAMVVPTPPVPPRKLAPATVDAPTFREERRLAGNNGQAVAKGARGILSVVAQSPDGASIEQLAVLTGLRRSSRSEYIRQLKAAGYVRSAHGFLFPTDEGIVALGSEYEPLPRGAALLSYWLARLPVGAGKILTELCEVYPAILSPDQIGELVALKRSSRSEYTRQLRACRLVEKADRGLRASPILFAEG